MRSVFGLILAVIFALVLSCTPEDEKISSDPDYILTFSSDTISFDTVFTSIGSTTKRLIVRNHNPNALNIESIFVGDGSDSPYSIIVAGKESNSVENQQILGNDSLLVLVKVSIDPSEASLPFVIRDSIVFLTNGNIQDVKLQSWGQNAHFIGDSVLQCNTEWWPDLPYFLYGSLLVDSLCTLTLLEEVKVYSSFDAFIFVKGTLRVNGNAGARVVFRNERLEQEYENIPGQWGGIIFLEGSKDNRINYADIRNAQYGVRLGSPDTDTIPDLTLSHVRIENTAVAGILAYTSDLVAENTLVNTSAGYVVGNLAGGHYRYDHCTFTNYPLLFFNSANALVVTDFADLEDGSTIQEPLSFVMDHSIVWGILDEEIAVQFNSSETADLDIRNSILKSSLDILEGSGNLLSTETDYMQFMDVINYDYTPDSLSPAINNAAGSEFINDLFGHQRDSLPDTGAIEYIPLN